MDEIKHCELIEFKNEIDETEEFYMDVQSVICLDGQCKIVDVRLFWDRLGEYIRYELADGVELEKKDGAPFSGEDYEKLQKILKDQNSVFEEVNLGEVVDINKSDAGIDGISGATILTDESASVKGAAWTCYTLWHWANGEVTKVISEITKNTVTSEELYSFYKDQEERYKVFAAELFRDRTMYDEVTLDIVKQSMLSLSINPSKAVTKYLSGAPFGTFGPILKEFFPKSRERQRRLLLKALLNYEEIDSEEFIVTLSEIIPQLGPYEEINLIADFIQEQRIDRPEINTELIPYLTKKNFISARRIYWLLKEQDLTNEEKIQVEAFEIKYKDSLW